MFKINRKYKTAFFGLFSVVFVYTSQGQAVELKADGPGNTYELINSMLAPGYNVVEHPECVHTSFGRHITEVWDDDLDAYVFAFHSHVSPDNDRCVSFDRQRIEIKTYDQSPANLIGTTGETITYKWQFKIPAGFKASSNFTHIHQIKPVNGDDGNPIFTLTVRKGNPNKMELIHDNSNKVAIVNLSLFEGEWVEATEVIRVGVSGAYSMQVKRLRDNATLINYTSNSIKTIRPDNDFIRPKWGIYRSLLNKQDLRDEIILFNNFRIEEGGSLLGVNWLDFKTEYRQGQVNLFWQTASETNNAFFIIERSVNGVGFQEIGRLIGAGQSNTPRSYQFADSKPTTGKNFYRIKQVDVSGSYTFSGIRSVTKEDFYGQSLSVFPNPVSEKINIQLAEASGSYKGVLHSLSGQSVAAHTGPVQAIGSAFSAQLGALTPGIYYLSLTNEKQQFITKFLKD